MHATKNVVSQIIDDVRLWCCDNFNLPTQIWCKWVSVTKSPFRKRFFLWNQPFLPFFTNRAWWMDRRKSDKINFCSNYAFTRPCWLFWIDLLAQSLWSNEARYSWNSFEICSSISVGNWLTNQDIIFTQFLDAPSFLYKRVCPSVRLSNVLLK